MLRVQSRASRPCAEIERAATNLNVCYSRKITYLECIERGWDPERYGLTIDSKPSEPILVDPALNHVRLSQTILPNRPPKNKRK